LHEKRGGSDPIHIVITVDRDGFLMFDGKTDAVYSLAHSFHLERIGVEIRLGLEEGARFGVGGVTAIKKDLPKEGWKGC